MASAPCLVAARLYCITSGYAVASALALGIRRKLIHYLPGLVECTEALRFFILLALIPAFGPYLWYAYATLEVATVIQRLLYAVADIRSA
jgi:hypothetical protein